MSNQFLPHEADQKQDVQFELSAQQVPPATESGGSGCGCVKMIMVFSVTTFMLCSGCCMGGYYAIFYTAFPLTYIERALEESGDFEIEGLTGSFSSGFKVDSWKWRDDEGNWNSFNDVEFRWNGLYQLSNENRFIIEEFTVGSAEIYHNPFPAADFSNSSSGDVSDFDGPNNDFGRNNNFQGESLREFRIDEFRLSNFTFVNKETDFRFHLNEISVKNFKILDGELTDLGDITIDCDVLEFRSQPSEHFPDVSPRAVRRKFTGVARAGIDKRIKQDVKYDMHVCFAKDGFYFDSTMFNDALKYSGTPDGSVKVQFQDFSAADFFELEETALPGKVTGTIESSKGKRKGDFVSKVTDGTTMKFGDTTFTFPEQTIEYNERDKSASRLSATGTLDGEEVRCHLISIPRKTSFTVVFETDNQPHSVELLAKVLFGKTLEELDESEKKVVEKMMQQSLKIASEP